jgi:hypothetical protein
MTTETSGEHAASRLDTSKRPLFPYVIGGGRKGRAPSAKDFRLIIEAAGGVWLTLLPDPKKKKDFDFSKLVLIMSNTDNKAKNQLSTARAREAITSLGANSSSIVEALFHAISHDSRR